MSCTTVDMALVFSLWRCLYCGKYWSFAKAVYLSSSAGAIIRLKGSKVEKSIEKPLLAPGSCTDYQKISEMLVIWNLDACPMSRHDLNSTARPDRRA